MSNWQQVELTRPIFTDEAPEPKRTSPQGAVEPVGQETLTKGSFDSVSSAQDHTGARYIAFVYNNGFGAWGRVIGPAGRQWELRCPPVAGIPHKADSISLLVVGNSLVVHMTSHATNEGPRVMAVWEATIPVVEEPCGEGALPYFRPGATLTRGQAAKIVASAAYSPDAIEAAKDSAQRFQDVPPGSTFFEFVNVLAADHAMGGYGCTPTKEG